MLKDFSKNEEIINAPFLYRGFAGWPSFSPDGNNVVFTADANRKNCYLSIVDVNIPSQITSIMSPAIGAKRPSWHPIGSKIAYNLNNETIWEYEIASGESKLYLQESIRKNEKLIHPCYAPDGKSIIVATNQRGGLQREEVLYRLNPTAENPIQQLTQYPHVCAGRPAVHPDNTYVVFAGHADFFNQVENRLWKVYPESLSYKLEEGDDANCHGSCPAISPDGKWIACVSTRPLPNPEKKTPKSVWIIRSDGSEAFKLTDDSLLPTHMAWSSDQKKLAVTGPYGLQLIGLPETFIPK